MQLPAVRLAIGCWTLFMLSGVITATHFTGTRGVALDLTIALVVAATLPIRYALPLATIGWAFATGFAANQAGTLTFTKTDLLRLATFIAACSLTSASASTSRSLPTPLRRELDSQNHPNPFSDRRWTPIPPPGALFDDIQPDDYRVDDYQAEERPDPGDLQ